jgi:hypothetical protein
MTRFPGLRRPHPHDVVKSLQMDTQRTSAKMLPISHAATTRPSGPPSSPSSSSELEEEFVAIVGVAGTFGRVVNASVHIISGEVKYIVGAGETETVAMEKNAANSGRESSLMVPELVSFLSVCPSTALIGINSMS